MLHSRLAPFELGKSARRYDTEEDAIFLLKWMEDAAKDLEKIPKSSTTASQSEDNLRREKWMNAGKALQNDDISVLAQIFPTHLTAHMSELMEDLYFAMKDTLAGRRVKTSATLMGGMGAGALVGFWLGSVLLPGIGSMVGGTLGAAIGGASLIGGTIGCTVLSAVAGSYLANQVAKKLFKHEKHYELSKRVTRKLKSEVGLSSKTAHLINDYLYNRAKSTPHLSCKQVYKTLRKHGIQQADLDGWIEIAHFFCYEFMLLEKEIQRKSSAPDSPELNVLKQERDIVHMILGNLKKAHGIPLNVKESIETQLRPNVFKELNKNKSDETALSLNKKVFEDAFQKNVDPHLSLETPQTANPLTKPSLQQHYAIKKDDKVLSDLTLEENEKGTQLLLTLDQFSTLSDQELNLVLKVLVSKAQAYVDSTKKTDCTIIAEGDDKLAILLMAVAFKAGLTPSLDSTEYPETTASQKQKKQSIIARAQRIARMDEPKVGLNKINLKGDPKN